MQHNSDAQGSIAIEKRIIFALDVVTAYEARQLMERLEGHIESFKLALQLFLSGWFPTVDWIVKRNLEVMPTYGFSSFPRP
jgi:hypothetical protein